MDPSPPHGGYVSPAYPRRQIQALDSVLPKTTVLAGRAPCEPDRTEEVDGSRRTMKEMMAVAIDVGTRIQSLRPGNRPGERMLTPINLWVNLCACGG